MMIHIITPVFGKMLKDKKIQITQTYTTKVQEDDLRALGKIMNFLVQERQELRG